MKITTYKCDYCGKETKDYYAEKGWIHIDEDKLVVTNGRTKEGKAIINSMSVLITFYGNSADFCSLSCLIKWLFLSKEINHGDDKIDRVSLLRNQISSLTKDDFLKGIIMECLKSENK